MRLTKLTSILLAVSGILVLFTYQNCAPVGTTVDTGDSASQNGTPDVGQQSPDNPVVEIPEPMPEPEPVIPPPPTPDPEPGLSVTIVRNDPQGCNRQTLVDGQLVNEVSINRRPSFAGWRANRNSGAYSLNQVNRSVVIGQGSARSGDSAPARVFVSFDRNGDQANQEHTFRCEFITRQAADGGDDDFFDSSCGEAVGNTFEIMKGQDAQCRAGLVEVRVSVEDACEMSNSRSSQSFVMRVNFSSGCVSEDKLVMPNIAVANNNMGVNTAIDGGWVAVTAPEEDSAGAQAGSVEVFQQNTNPNFATHRQKLVANDTGLDNSFMRSVAISGNYLAAGAPGKASFQGAVYIFKNNSGTWTQIAKLTPPGGGADKWFGYSLAMDGTLLVVGAHQDNEEGVQAGAAYVYRRSGDSFTMERKLLAGSDGGPRHYFGYDVAVDGNNIIVGAPVREFNSSTGGGQAFLFRANNNYAKTNLFGSNPNGSQLGYSVDISGNYAIAGAPRRSGGGSDPNGDGAAFVRNISNSFTRRLEASNADGRFGESVAIGQGNENGQPYTKAIVGAVRSTSQAGAISYFKFNNDSQLDQNRSDPFEIRARDRANRDEFGYSVSTDGNHAVVGAWLDTVRQAGRNWDKAGSAYLIELDPPN